MGNHRDRPPCAPCGSWRKDQPVAGQGSQHRVKRPKILERLVRQVSQLVIEPHRAASQADLSLDLQRRNRQPQPRLNAIRGQRRAIQLPAFAPHLTMIGQAEPAPRARRDRWQTFVRSDQWPLAERRARRNPPKLRPPRQFPQPLPAGRQITKANHFRPQPRHHGDSHRLVGQFDHLKAVKLRSGDSHERCVTNCRMGAQRSKLMAQSSWLKAQRSDPRSSGFFTYCVGTDTIGSVSWASARRRPTTRT